MGSNNVGFGSFAYSRIWTEPSNIDDTNSSFNGYPRQDTSPNDLTGCSDSLDKIPYTPTSNKIVFRLNHNRVWDNVHIVFYRSDGSVIGQEFPGYLMEPWSEAGDNFRDSNGKLVYEITIPEGATHFRINNGTLYLNEQVGSTRFNNNYLFNL